MSAFAATRARMIAAGLVDADTGRLTAAGMAHTDRIIADLKAAPPAAEAARPHPGARLPAVRWNTRRAAHLKEQSA